MRTVTSQEFDSLVADRDDVFAAIGKIYKRDIEPHLVREKKRMIKEDRALTFDIVFITNDIWEDRLQCAAVTTFWWHNDKVQARVSHFIVYNDDEEMMRVFGNNKMKELDLPAINPN
jgi:hypothetical protein